MESGVHQGDRSLMLLRSAAELGSVEEKRSFLEAACQDDPALLAGLLETVTVAGAVEPSCEPSDPVAPGQIVADRFHVVRKLGEGGMASVYEAIDGKLMERRALKFPKSRHHARFPEEVRAALRVTHENICRIHEIHATETADGPSDFLSMELIEGETLLARSRRAPLAAAEAIDLARQLCLGLNAAHSAGILHQDLKGNNVMLARRAGGSVRAVIMDFGLAQPFGPVGGRQDKGVGGTPNYIAPERWRGAPATPSADIYALGVVLYEMLAGRLPFPRDAAWTIRLNALPAPPSRSPRAPDSRWDAIVLRCLQPDPARRFSSAAQVLRAIDRAFGTRRRRMLAAAAVVLVAAAAPVAVFRDRIWPAPVARLALLPFSGSAGDRAVDEGARGALYDVARQLESLGAASQRVVVIPVEESVRNDVRTASDAAARLGATHALSGSIAPRRDGFALQATVTDSRSGALLRTFGGEYRRTDIASLPGSLAGVVTSAFWLATPPRAAVNPAAYPAYAAGLSALRGAPPDLDRAIASLRSALESDAASAALHGALADALQRKFASTRDRQYLAEARAKASRAQSLQPDSPAVLLVAGTIEEIDGRPERALEMYQRAAALEPENSEGYRRTGVALQRLGREAEAVASLRRAIQLAPGHYLPRQSLGFVLFRAGRYAEAAEEYRAVTGLAPGLPDGYGALGALLMATGRDEEAEATFRKALELRETRLTLNNLGILLVYRRRDGEALEVFKRALRVGADDAGLRLNLGLALRRLGRPREARDQFERASAMTRAALLADPRDAVARARLSYTLLRLGNKDLGADEALQAARLAPADYSVLFWCVMTLEAAGRRTDATGLLATASQERLRDLRRQPDLADLAADPRFRALLRPSDSQSANERNHSK